MSSQFHQLLLAQLPKLRAYAFLLTRNRADADDLVQTSVMRALKAESRFEMGTNFSAWTYMILKNCHISNCRSAKHKSTALDDVPESVLSSRAVQEDGIRTNEVLRAMDKLSPNMREVLSLVCGAGLSYDDAALALSCSVGTVKSRLWRAREQMKILLDAPAEAVSPPILDAHQAR